ncbi:MAG: calcium/sodium antiporter [Gammaproteobacteria bacterium]|nr:MAG: calcium/sodium antiporter [Gammaproteobacteria bacterium]
MLLDIIYVVVGLVVLLWSADKFIDGAAATASYLGMSPLMVGMLIVGFGTSAPEMIVSAFAAANGNPGIALGNAYGSNIANIGLVLGITALLYPLSVGSRIVRREIPLLALVLLICLGFLYDLSLNRVEAGIMLLAIVVIMIFNTFYSNDNDILADEFHSDIQAEAKTTPGKSLLWLITGLLLLLVSSKYLVNGAVGIAEFFGVSDLIIGLTIVAIGTSLPELASSIAAAKKGEPDIVLGNIIGSCLFNALAVVGIAGIIKPLSIDKIFLYRDFSTGLVLALLLWAFTFGIRGKSLISKKAGGIFLLAYIAYTMYLLSTMQTTTV